MSDFSDLSDCDDSGNDVTNNNYRVLGGQEVQKLNNITLPCMLFLESDLGASESDRQSSPQRTFHIEINEEIHHDQRQVIPFRCHTLQPEEGFGMVTHKHIAHAIKAHHGTDVQKTEYMINCVKEFEEMLCRFAFDEENKLHERFDVAEKRLYSDIAELNKGIGTISGVVGKLHEMLETYSKMSTNKTTEHDTQTEAPSSRNKSNNDVKKMPLSPSNSIKPTNTVQLGDIKEATCLEYEYQDSPNDIEEYGIERTTTIVDSSYQNENEKSNEEMSKSTSEIDTETITSKISTAEIPVPDWKIDHSSWSTCLELKDRQLVEKLLNEKKLPDQLLLDKACCIFGRSSTEVSNICKAICSYLRGKAPEKLTDLWPANRYDKSVKTVNEEITFVAIKADKCQLGIEDEYRMYVREASMCSPESKYINKLEYESEEMNSIDLSALTNCVNENSAMLMHHHSRLTMVSASYVKSKGYNTKNRAVDNQHCITLYVHVKGFIPLQEEAFPEKIGSYPVDVREAVFKQFVGGNPHDCHENLRMGCAIMAKTLNEHGQIFAGTLGGFLDHPQYGVCCLTCAHVICRNFNKIPNTEGTHVPVCQPCREGSPSFGHLIDAVYDSGGLGNSGVEVALIKVDSRAPVDGYFPDTNKNCQTGFSEDKPMAYCSGKICELEKLNKGSVVIKYGCFTELTRGVFRLQGGAVRTCNPVGKHTGADFLLHNQIEILSAGEEIFAIEGDSGAFVFIQEEMGELSLIGMLEGGLDDGRFIVTPIKDILNALHLPIDGTLKTFVNNVDYPSSLSCQLLNPNVSFRCSTPQPSSSRPFSSSRTDSAISMNTSVSEDFSSISMSLLVDEKLKVANEKMSQDVAKYVSDIKTEMSEDIDEKLKKVKTDLKQEIQQSIKQQTEMIEQMLKRFASPQTK